MGGEMAVNITVNSGTDVCAAARVVQNPSSASVFIIAGGVRRELGVARAARRRDRRVRVRRAGPATACKIDLWRFPRTLR